MRKVRNIKRTLQLTGIVITIVWAAALIVFFSDPIWSKTQIGKVYNWFADKRPVAILKAEPCKEHETFAWQMVDSVEQYWWHSMQQGIEPLRFVRDIDRAVKEGELVPVHPTETYLLDTMHYSFPFAVPKTKAFIDTIALRFQRKLINTDLYGVRLVVTSVLRTRSSVARLVRHNRNAIKNSAHLHGTTFDLSYATYDFQRPVTHAEAEYLREVLATTLFELRKEKKCWVTYEIFQTCFHVVTR